MDRSLGVAVAEGLAQAGWIVHEVAKTFPNDAQETGDEEWIAYGLRRSWALLSKDKHIRYRASELTALAEGRGTLFVLGNGNWRIREQLQAFEASRVRIFKLAAERPTALYVVYAETLAKQWPEEAT